MINTNGFMKEYLDTVENGLWLEKESKRLTDELAPAYEEIKQINEKYDVKNKETKYKDVLYSIKTNNNRKDYYYFRSIVDGVYNLLKEYGWKYQYELLKHLKHTYSIDYVLDEGFEVFFVDVICDMTPSTVLSSLWLPNQRIALRYGDDYCNYFLIPSDLNIEDTLVAAHDFLKTSVTKDKVKEEDEEYKTYLRLKEKYEVK